MADNTYNLLTQMSLNSDDFKSGIDRVKANVRELMLGVDGAKGNINEMQKALNALKNVSFAGKTIEEISAINTRIAQLKTSIAELNKEQGNIKPPAPDSEKLSAYALVVGKVGVAIHLAKEAFEVFKQVMESNAMTAEKYEIAMAQMEGATNSFFRTIANGDWSNLFTNMQKAIQASKDYTEAMRVIKNEQRGTSIFKSEGEARIAQIRVELVGLKAKGVAGKSQFDTLLEEALQIRTNILKEELSTATQDVASEMKKLLSQIGQLNELTPPNKFGEQFKIYYELPDESGAVQRFIDGQKELNKNYKETAETLSQDTKQKIIAIDTLVRFRAGTKEQSEALKEYLEIIDKMKASKQLEMPMSMGPGLGGGIQPSSGIDMTSHIDKLREESNLLIRKFPELASLGAVLRGTTQPELDKLAAKMITTSEVVKEAYTKTLKLTKQGIMEELMGEKADKKDEEAKKGIELITENIKKLKAQIAEIITQGGVVQPKMLTDLNDLESQLARVTKQMDVYNLSDKLMKMKEPKTPIVSMIPKTPLAGLAALPNRTAEIAQLAQNEMNITKNLMKFKNTMYEDDVKKYSEALRKKEMTEEEYASKIKGLDKEVNLFKINAVGDAVGKIGGLFAQQTVAYKALSVTQIGIATAVAAIAALQPPPIGYGPLLGPWAAGGIIAGGAVAIAKVLGANYGAIVPGSNYSGDRTLIAANAGEMILSSGQQNQLFSMLNGTTGTNNGEVIFRIQGTELVGVLNNHARKIKSMR